MTYVLTPPISFTFPHPTFPTGAPAQGWSLRGGVCTGLGVVCAGVQDILSGTLLQ